MRALAVIFMAFIAPTDVLAYIDPGSGMLAWQGLIAAIGGVLIFFRKPVATIKLWIQRLRGK
jgi:hypothetical protein